MKNVAVIGIVGIPACYGGFETLVDNLTKNSSETVSYSVFCSSRSYEEQKSKYNKARLIYLPFSANGIMSVFYDALCLIRCLFMKPDVTLVLGVSGCIFLPFYKMFSSSKVIINIDGLEWKRGKWHSAIKKFLKFSEKIAVKFSDVIICDNQAIADYVKAEYDKECSVIAYGGDHVIPNKKIAICKSDYFFSVCRIEPENNVEMILKAFSETDMRLKFVGNWDSSAFGVVLKERFGDCPNIEFINPIYDIEHLYKLRKACKAYLHGHSAGGTNPSLVEAMHFEIPILAYDCVFNRYSTDNRALYFSSSQALKEILGSFDNNNYQRTGEFMKEIASKKYTWKKISSAYELFY
jgi:glycosyltransferase involved in cell wall biosynthesis